MSHQPVLVEAVVKGLAIGPGATVLDATVGLGGHAESLLKAAGPSGRLIGIDRDPQALEQCQGRLKGFQEQMKLIHASFGQLAAVLEELGVRQLDAALFDLGVSSFQLETAQRGFSFLREGPLDMRMDVTQGRSAAEMVNRLSAHELTEIIRELGQERWASRIARAIVKRRPFSTTTDLAQVIRQAVPGQGRKYRIHPATRTFQAIRIAVNEELDLLPQGLHQAIEKLKSGGRIAVLAYHSLEDRIVKTVFREKAAAGALEIVTRKPIRPSPEEVQRNVRSRSAHLRIGQKR